MRREYPPTVPNEEAGKSWSKALPAGVAEIGLDEDVLRTFAGEWQVVANNLRLAAADAAKVGGQAVSEVGDFQTEYRPDGVYDGDYESMTTGDTAVAQKLIEAADHAETVAGAAAWTADNWEEVQKEAAARVEDIESDITVGTDAQGKAPNTAPASSGDVDDAVDVGTGALNDIADTPPDSQPA